MIFLFRLFPFIGAVFVGAAFYIQFRRPFEYPWIVLSGALAVICGAILMSRKRIAFADLLEKMLPTAILLLALGFASLLIEGQLGQYGIIVVGAVSSYLSLELLFFLTFMPSRYPVHGLSRVNIAYVPFIIWYSSVPSIGLITFLHSPKWVHVALMAVLGLVLFRTTGHPEATIEQNRRWMFVGLITGFQLGLLGIMLPLSMEAHGALAMMTFSIILRMRRFMHNPLPSLRQAWMERAGALILLVVIVLTSRWL